MSTMRKDSPYMIDSRKTLLSLLLGTQLFMVTSCQFGNYADQPVDNSKGAYKSTDLYFTEPSQFDTVVIYNDGTATTSNPNTPMAAIPLSLLNQFTDPVYYMVPTDTTKSSFFMDLSLSYAINTIVDSTGAINNEIDSSVVTFWSNPNCQTQVQKIQSGAFNKSSGVGTVISFPDGSTSKTAGRLTMDFTYIRVIQGDCSADLTYLAQCYKTGTGCSSNDLSAANGLFDLYVNRGGVLNIDNAAKIKALAYIVHFQ